MARITPRITPYVPKPRNISPAHLIKNAPRAILTGNIPHPRLGGMPLRLNSAPAKAVAPKIAQLTQATHKGRARQPNPKPKTPGQLTGIKTKPTTTVKMPSSQAAQRPGIPSLQGTKIKVRRANPYKVPNLHLH